MKIEPETKISISEEVSNAIEQDQPVVALESTVISHGLPYPHNRDVALEMEREIRLIGAVPATIGVLDGRIRIGLVENEIERLAAGKNLTKISVRDISLAIANSWSGGTTVAGTIFFARKAKIRIFATGGIGGVHRGHNYDISADLIQLSKTPIIVVCSGAKAILNLQATIEYLETFSIPVIGYQTNELPAFYSRSSGIYVDARADTVDEIVEIARTNWGLGLENSILVVNPPPVETEISSKQINHAVEQALAEAEQDHINGKNVTPYLLQKVAEKTSGESMRANLGLLKSNARLAGMIAIADSRR